MRHTMMRCAEALAQPSEQASRRSPACLPACRPARPERTHAKEQKTKEAAAAAAGVDSSEARRPQRSLLSLSETRAHGGSTCQDQFVQDVYRIHE